MLVSAEGRCFISGSVQISSHIMTDTKSGSLVIFGNYELLPQSWNYKCKKKKKTGIDVDFNFFAYSLLLFSK